MEIYKYWEGVLGWYGYREDVMVLAEIELIFFTLAGIVLYFEISMEKKTC